MSWAGPGWERREKVLCKNNVNSLSGVEAPREAGWSLYRELDRWTVYIKGLWRRNGVRASSYVMSLSAFNRAEERAEKGKESV